MNELVKVDEKAYGIESSKAKEIEVLFSPMLSKMTEKEKEYNELIKLEKSHETCLKAKTLRLEFVKIRTGTAKIHKELKHFYLMGGRLVDAWKQTQLTASQGLEEKLKNIEDHYINIEKEKIKKLCESRESELRRYSSVNIPEMLNAMSDDVWANYILGAKLNYEANQEEIRQENERLKQEAIEKEEQARLKQVRLQKIADQERQKAQDERIKVEKEVAKEKAILEHKAQVERAKRAEAEAELKLRKEEEARAKAEDEERAEVEAKKGDKEKFEDFKKEIKNILNKYSFKSEKYNNIKEHIMMCKELNE